MSKRTRTIELKLYPEYEDFVTGETVPERTTEAEAYNTAADGLVAHRGFLDAKTWTLTHEPSGWYIAKGLPRLRDARELARRLAWIDWTVPDEVALFEFWDNVDKRRAGTRSLPGYIRTTRGNVIAEALAEKREK